MNKVKVKGNDIVIPRFKDSFSRRAQNIENKICQNLLRLGVERDDVEVNMQPIPIKKHPASARWYFDGANLIYEHSGQRNYIENLFVVSKIIEIEVNKLIDEEITKQEFKQVFEQEEDLEDKKIEAKQILGLDENENDLDKINKAYKDLAKKNHPDIGGNIDTFKKINYAHKLLKKELS